MHVCVYMCVCTCVCVRLCVHASVYMCVCVLTHLPCIYIRISVQLLEVGPMGRAGCGGGSSLSGVYYAYILGPTGMHTIALHATLS